LTLGSIAVILVLVGIVAIWNGQRTARHVLRSGLPFLLLVLGLAALNLPTPWLVGIGALGLSYIIGDGIFTHKAEAASESTQRDVQKRLDVLDELTVNRRLDLNARAMEIVDAIDAELNSRQLAKTLGDSGFFDQMQMKDPEVRASEDDMADFQACNRIEKEFGAAIKSLFLAAELYVDVHPSARTYVQAPAYDLNRMRRKREYVEELGTQLLGEIG
jgi:hypothetical protein